MKLGRKVSAKEVKRAFVVAHEMKHKPGANPKLGSITNAEFEKRLREAKKKVAALPEAKLDAIIKWKPRVIAYDVAEWHLGTVTTGEVGVWKRAGEMPLAWTNGSLKETARAVAKNLAGTKKLARVRARSAIPGILETKTILAQREKYLFPIIFKSGTGTRGRRGLKRKLKGDIDDGCMRSIALAIHGAKTLKAYIGVPKKLS